MGRLGEVMRLKDFEMPIGIMPTKEETRIQFIEASASWGLDNGFS